MVWCMKSVKCCELLSYTIIFHQNMGQSSITPSLHYNIERAIAQTGSLHRRNPAGLTTGSHGVLTLVRAESPNGSHYAIDLKNPLYTVRIEC